MAPNDADRGSVQGLAALGPPHILTFSLAQRRFPWRSSSQVDGFNPEADERDASFVAAATITRCDHQGLWVCVPSPSLSAPSLGQSFHVCRWIHFWSRVRCQGLCETIWVREWILTMRDMDSEDVKLHRKTSSSMIEVMRTRKKKEICNRGMAFVGRRYASAANRTRGPSNRTHPLTDAWQRWILPLNH